MKSKVQEELKQHFRPEFLNRVDDIVVFHQLTPDEIIKIVDLMLAQVDQRLKDRDMGLELTPGGQAAAGRAWLRPGAWAPGRCAGRSSASSRTPCRRRSSTASSVRARSSRSRSRARATNAKFTFVGEAAPVAQVPDSAAAIAEPIQN